MNNRVGAIITEAYGDHSRHAKHAVRNHRHKLHMQNNWSEHQLLFHPTKITVKVAQRFEWCRHFSPKMQKFAFQMEKNLVFESSVFHTQSNIAQFLEPFHHGVVCVCQMNAKIKLKTWSFQYLHTAASFIYSLSTSECSMSERVMREIRDSKNSHVHFYYTRKNNDICLDIFIYIYEHDNNSIKEERIQDLPRSSTMSEIFKNNSTSWTVILLLDSSSKIIFYVFSWQLMRSYPS